MAKRLLTLVLGGFFLPVFFGCAQKTTVVLLTDPQGQVGHIAVTNDTGTLEMSRSDEAAVIVDRKTRPRAPEILPEDEIAARYAETLAALPGQPGHFILYFESNSPELTPESLAMLPQILQWIHDRNSQNISVIGHTDTVGDKEYNLVLSTNRAQTVSRLLIREGIPPADIVTTSHGKENPLIPTGDNVNEPRNRRVEVIIR